ncbi:hypothetical protein L3X38_017066 [Prunus dulcis]|uniref:Trichome birefringence-like C-terminal domain-containing protein n=1 Tax=Prunus dulcis TaxID=3755 RepID=A0AAD4Z9F4_PRUDU|nr:hypothetical protein L3X38_017066 [Prunus dulcis]
MFVGDSLSLNQWQSLTCMLHTSNPHAHYKLFKTGGLSTFTFPAYKIKVMISRNAFLVDTIATTAGQVLKLDSIESGKMWKEIDVLIFNSWHWWLHTGRKQPVFPQIIIMEVIGESQLQSNVRDKKPMVGHQYPENRWASICVWSHGGHKDMDCSHWCLAGVPDTWNVLLYAALTQRKTN